MAREMRIYETYFLPRKLRSSLDEWEPKVEDGESQRKIELWKNWSWDTLHLALNFVGYGSKVHWRRFIFSSKKDGRIWKEVMQYRKVKE